LAALRTWTIDLFRLHSHDIVVGIISTVIGGVIMYLLLMR
jgi:hypothetical protein